MSKIEVTVYEKTESYCRYCKSMWNHFSAWRAKTDQEVDVEVLSAEEHRDKLIELGATAAPVYIIKRDGNEATVYGNNPDVMVDYLEGIDGVWSF